MYPWTPFIIKSSCLGKVGLAKPHLLLALQAGTFPACTTRPQVSWVWRTDLFSKMKERQTASPGSSLGSAWFWRHWDHSGVLAGEAERQRQGPLLPFAALGLWRERLAQIWSFASCRFHFSIPHSSTWSSTQTLNELLSVFPPVLQGAGGRGPLPLLLHRQDILWRPVQPNGQMERSICRQSGDWHQVSFLFVIQLHHRSMKWEGFTPCYFFLVIPQIWPFHALRRVRERCQGVSGNVELADAAYGRGGHRWARGRGPHPQLPCRELVASRVPDEHDGGPALPSGLRHCTLMEGKRRFWKRKCFKLGSTDVCADSGTS